MTAGASGAPSTRRGVFDAAAEALREALGNDRIRRLELAWSSGIAADGALLLTLLVVAYESGGPAAVGILAAIRMAFSPLAGPLAGSAVARRPPESVLLVIHLVRATLALAIAGLLVVGAPIETTWLPAAIVALATAFVRPIQAGTFPSIARSPGELVAANVVMSFGEGLGTFAGPLIAGVAIAVVGAPVTCIAAAVLFGVAAWSMVGIRGEGGQSVAGRRLAATRPAVSPVAQIRSGLAALARRRGPAAIVAGFEAQVFVRGLLTTLIVVAAIELLAMGESGPGILNAALGAGGLGGGLLAMTILGRGRLGSSFALALATWGLPIAVIAVLPIPGVALVALVVIGLSNATLDVVGFTLIQRGVPSAERVPVFGVLEAAAGLVAALGGLLAPVLIAQFGVRGALALAGAILPIVAVLLWPRVRRADSENLVPDHQVALIRSIPLFAPLTLTAIEELAAALVPVTFPAGDVLLAEGETGRRYLILESGRAAVTQDGQLVNTLLPGSGCGEISLLRSVPITATVTATEPVGGFALDRADFLAAIAGPRSAAIASAVVEEHLSRSAAAAS